MDWPKIARTSSSFLALPVTKVIGRDNTSPEVVALAAAAISAGVFFCFVQQEVEQLFNDKIRDLLYNIVLFFWIILDKELDSAKLQVATKPEDTNGD